MDKAKKYNEAVSNGSRELQTKAMMPRRVQSRGRGHFGDVLQKTKQHDEQEGSFKEESWTVVRCHCMTSYISMIS